MIDVHPKRKLAAVQGERLTNDFVTPGQEVRDPRFAVLDARIAAGDAQEARIKARRPAKSRKKTRRPSPPRKSRGAITGGAKVVTVAESAPGGLPAASALPPVADGAGDPPVDGGGQAGAQAELTAADQRPHLRGVERAVKTFAARLRRDYAGQLADDQAARIFKKRAKSLLGRNLPPFAGRPKEASITRATELRRQGCAWKSIYPEVIPNHTALHPAVRREAERKLRAAIRSRHNARARRKREGESIAQQTTVVNVPS